MANYKDIHGTTVRNSAGNLSGAVTGELFYDSTNLAFKYQYPTVTTVGTWRTANSINTARGGLQGGGIQTSAIVAGGGDGPPWGAGAGTKQNAETYNGTTWTEVGDLGSARYDGDGTGSSNTAAIVFAGFLSPGPTEYQTQTEVWDGSSWTEVSDLNTRGKSGGGCGNSSTAALFVGRYGGTPDVAQKNVEQWNGSSWTEIADLNLINYTNAAFGTTTAAISCGGIAGVGPTYDEGTANTELWNGTTWTEVNNLNLRRRNMDGAGIQTSGLIAGDIIQDLQVQLMLKLNYLMEQVGLKLEI